MVGHVSGVATMIARNAHVYAARSAQKAYRVAGTRFVYTYRTEVSRVKFLAPSGQPGGSFYAVWRWFGGEFAIFWGLEEPCHDCSSGLGWRCVKYTG